MQETSNYINDPKKAYGEAEKIKELAGDNPTAGDYVRANSTLVRESTEKELAGKSWIETTKSTVQMMDRKKRAEDLLPEAKRKLEQLTQQIEVELAKFEQINHEIEAFPAGLAQLKESKTLSLDFISNSFSDALRYLPVEMDDIDVEELKQTILRKLGDASWKRMSEGISEDIPLSDDEVKLAKLAIAAAIKSLPGEQKHLAGFLKKLRDQYRDTYNNVGAFEQEIIDFTDRIAVAIAQLDKLEEESGAPVYPTGEEDEATQFEAYLARIKWREDQFAAEKRSLPAGDKIERKMALFVKIGRKYLLLDRNGSYDDTRQMRLITNRLPIKTFAVYSEGLFTSSKASLFGTVDNGVYQKASTDDKSAYEPDLKTHFNELKSQLR